MNEDAELLRTLLASDPATRKTLAATMGGPPTAATRPREQPAKSDAELGIDGGMIRPGPLDAMRVHPTAALSPGQREQRLRSDAGPLADDWIAQNIVAGIPAAGAGALVGPATRALMPAIQGTGRVANVARAATDLVPRVAGGSAEGTAAAAGVGADPRAGGAFGAAVPMVPPALRALATRAPERIATRITQKVAQGAGPSTRAHIYDIGPGDIAPVAREFKLVGGGPEAIKNGLNTVSAEMQAPYATVHRAGVVPQETVSRALDTLEQDWARTQATQPFAADVAGLRQRLESQYIDFGGPTARQLQDEITAFNKSAFGGNYANPSIGKNVERRVSGALKEALNEHLDGVAATAPEQAAAVATIKALNKKMEVLKTLEPAIKKQAVDKMLPSPKTIPQKKSMLVGAAKGLANRADDIRNWAAEASSRAQAPVQVVSQPVSDALTSGDRRRAIDLIGQEVYGE